MTDADLLRQEGFTIHGRRANTAPTWQRFGRGEVFTQAAAINLAMLIRGNREQRNKDAEMVIKPKKPSNLSRSR